MQTAQLVRKVAPEFEHINRYWDPGRETVAAKVGPGELYVSADDEMLVATLGASCAVFLCDSRSATMAVLHFLLPSTASLSVCGEFVVRSEPSEFVEALLQDVLLPAFCRAGGSIETSFGFVCCGDRHDASPKERRLAFSSHAMARTLLEEHGVYTEQLRSHNVPLKVYCHPDGQLQWHYLDRYGNTLSAREAAFRSRMRACRGAGAELFEYVSHGSSRSSRSSHRLGKGSFS